MEIGLVLETVISTLIDRARIRGQDPGARGRGHSHHGRAVVLHHVVVVDIEVGKHHRRRAEGGGGGAQAIRAILAIVIEAVAEIEAEAGIEDNPRGGEDGTL